MNLKAILAAWDIYRQAKKLDKEKAMGMGWKTIAGAIIVGLGYAAKTLSYLDPMWDQIGDGLIGLGAVLGGIGIRAAVAKQGRSS